MIKRPAFNLMIEIVPHDDPDVIVVRMQGIAPINGFEKLAGALETSTQNGDARILFDWTKLQEWKLSSSEPKMTESWIRLARATRCAAIVHHSRWNRQAAWLAAALRLHDVKVRSWRRDEGDRAMAWLRSDCSSLVRAEAPSSNAAVFE